jgi:hypothetical protein
MEMQHEMNYLLLLLHDSITLVNDSIVFILKILENNSREVSQNFNHKDPKFVVDGGIFVAVVSDPSGFS